MPKVLKSVVFALVLLAAVASAAMVVASKSYALLPGDSASGHGTLSRENADGDPVKRQFSFSARTHADGTVTGHAVLINPEFEGENGNAYQLHVDISCMKVVGNIAVFGGTTKRTNDPSLVDAVFFSVQDNGEPGGGADKISSVFFWDGDPTTTGDPQACLLTGALDFPLNTIESGNIQVRSSAL